MQCSSLFMFPERNLQGFKFLSLFHVATFEKPEDPPHPFLCLFLSSWIKPSGGVFVIQLLFAWLQRLSLHYLVAQGRDLNLCACVSLCECACVCTHVRVCVRVCVSVRVCLYWRWPYRAHSSGRNRPLCWTLWEMGGLKTKNKKTRMHCTLAVTFTWWDLVTQ